jgi:3-deoxy-D-manno-octulosonic-acid transferase
LGRPGAGLRRRVLLRWLYSQALRLLTPVYLARLWWRGRKEPVYRKRLGERLGYYELPPRRGKGGVVWVHAVSYGENKAAAPLVEALRREIPNMRLLLTCSTATGVQAGLDILKPEDDHAWFPYDTPGAVRRFLKRYRPAVGVVMETEVWPNVMARAQALQIPMVLANARLSAKSQRKGRRFARLLVPALLGFTRILAQTARDAQRLREMGARTVEVCGNT